MTRLNWIAFRVNASPENPTPMAEANLSNRLLDDLHFRHKSSVKTRPVCFPAR